MKRTPLRGNRILVCLTTAVLLAVSVLLLYMQMNEEAKVSFYAVVGTGEDAQTISAWENEQGICYMFLPGYAQLEQVQLYCDEDSVKINGTSPCGGMSCEGFLLDTEYELQYDAWGKNCSKRIVFTRSAPVPAMYIDTQSGSMEYIHRKKGNEEPGSLRLYAADGTLDYAGALEEINGRGNYGWDKFDKKPYSLRLGMEGDLLGMGAAQKWILLSNASDPSNIRNKIVYDMAQTVGLAYSPEARWVDLYLNGEYAGLYLLCERNEVHQQRVNLARTDSFLVSMDVDSRLIRNQNPYVTTQAGQTLRVHYPADPSKVQLDQITSKLQSVENALLAEDGVDPITGRSWQELIDLDSWVRKYLIEEISGNLDAGFISQYYYWDSSDGGDKVYAGPVWDYDLSLGNPAQWQLPDPNSFFANRPQVKEGYETPWFYELYRKQPFYDRMAELYRTEFFPLLEELKDTGIADYTRQIEAAAAMNRLRGGTEEEENDPYARTASVGDYLARRTDFLSSIWTEGKQYCMVRISYGLNENDAWIAVEPGKPIGELPEIGVHKSAVHSGYRYADTMEPFDPERPIYEDTHICIQWTDSRWEKLTQIIECLPLAGFVLLSVVLLPVGIRRIRRGG